MPLAAALFNTVGLLSIPPNGAEVEVAFQTNPGSSAPVWTDITPYVRSVQIRRGRQHELDRTEAGTLRVELNNHDRRFDPTYTSSPYYPNVLPMRRIRVTGRFDRSAGLLYSGFVESWGQRYVGKLLTFVSVEAADGFKVLSLKKLNTTYAAERSDVRVANVLNDIGWSTADRTLSTGVSTFQQTSLSETPALEHLQTVAQSENGRLYISGAGRVVFQDRHTPYNTTTINATFGDSSAAGELPYTGLELEYGDANIWNEVRVQRTGGLTQVVADTATSQARFFPRTLPRTGLLLDGDNEASANAQFLLTNYKDPGTRITAIEVTPDQNPTTVYPQVLTRELGDRINVIRRPAVDGATGSAALTQESFIEGIEHAIQPGTLWKTNYRLSPIGIGYALAPIILDNTTDGVLGTTRTLVY